LISLEEKETKGGVGRTQKKKISWLKGPGVYTKRRVEMTEIKRRKNQQKGWSERIGKKRKGGKS